MRFYHNSQNETYRTPFGAVEPDSPITLAILAEDSFGAEITLKITTTAGEEMSLLMQAEAFGDALMYAASFTAAGAPTLMHYYFEITHADGSVSYYGNNPERLGGEGAEYDTAPPPFQITVFAPDSAPDWYKRGVVYQIFPDRFRRSADWQERQALAAETPRNSGPRRIVQQDWDDRPFYSRDSAGAVTRWAFFGGTLEGICEKLDYIRSLGATVIYLNPIFKGASNHKYDTADYMQIDPGFGDEKTFRKLCSEAEKRGIRIILDGVFSHTGADSIYFNKFGNYDSVGAAQGKKSRYYKWYSFTDFPDEYDSWWGVGDLPNVRELEPSYRKYIYEGKNSVIRKWLRLGASGWRLDVADELPDEFIKGIRAAMKEEKPDSVLLGEVWEDASNKESYGELREYLLGEELQSTMNYPFRSGAIGFVTGAITAGELCRAFMSLFENYPRELHNSALNLVGSHDRRRILTVLGDAEEPETDLERELYRLPEEKRLLAVRRLKILTLLQFTHPGVPSIYYADEAGAEGFTDPHNRGTFPWGSEDAELTEHFRKMSELRAQHEAFLSGEYLPLAFSEHVYGAYREGGGERLLVLINRGIFEHESVQIPADAEVQDILHGGRYLPVAGEITVPLEPISAVVLKF